MEATPEPRPTIVLTATTCTKGVRGGWRGKQRWRRLHDEIERIRLAIETRKTPRKPPTLDLRRSAPRDHPVHRLCDGIPDRRAPAPIHGSKDEQGAERLHGSTQSAQFPSARP